MRSNVDDNAAAEAMALLCVTNISPLFQPCTTLSEFAGIRNTLQSRSASSSGAFQWLKIDPDACARTSVVRILPTDVEQVEAVREISMWLQYALDQQRSRTYVTWWCPATAVVSLKTSLLDLCDLLDPTHSIADWPSADVASVFRKYIEQQRVRSRCSVLVLENCSDSTLLYFLESLCPAWGLTVFVLPERRLDPATVAALHEVFPVVDVVNVPPLTGSMPEMTESEMLDERSRTLLVPHVVRSLGFMTDDDRKQQQQQQHLLSARSGGSSAEDSGSGASADMVDTSYLFKYMKETGYRPLLLKLCVILMRVSGRDSYETLHALRERAVVVTERIRDSPPPFIENAPDEACPPFQAAGPAKTNVRYWEDAGHAVAVLELLLESVQEPNFVTDMLVLAVMSPLAVPMALFSPSFSTFIDASGIARRTTPGPSEESMEDHSGGFAHEQGSWCGGVAIPSTWLMCAFRMSLTEQQIRRGLEAVATRMARLDAYVQRHGDDDARLFALHDRISLGVKRVQSLHVDPLVFSEAGKDGHAHDGTNPSSARIQVRDDKEENLGTHYDGSDGAGRAESAAMGSDAILHDDGGHSARRTGEPAEVPLSAAALPIPVRHREWLRWRASIAQAVSQIAYSLRYFLQTRSHRWSSRREFATVTFLRS